MSSKLRSKLSLLTIFTFVSVSTFSVVSMADSGKGHEKNMSKRSFYSNSINSDNNKAYDKINRALNKPKTIENFDFKAITTAGEIEFHERWDTTPGAIGFHRDGTTTSAIELNENRNNPVIIHFHGVRTTPGAIEWHGERTTPGGIEFHGERTTPGGIEFHGERTTPGGIEFHGERTTPGGIEFHRNTKTLPSGITITPRAKTYEKKSKVNGKKHR